MAALATAPDNSTGTGGNPSSHDTCSPVHRTETRRNTEFITQAENSRRMIEKLEKELSVSVKWRKKLWMEAWEEVDAYGRHLERERHAEKMQLQQQMVTIENSVRRFKRLLTDVKPTAHLIERLKEVMSDVETSINAVKEEQRLRFLERLREERTCQQEMNSYVKKLEQWSLPVTVHPTAAATPTKIKAPDQSLPVDVQALDVFLQRMGGADGGWDHSDHMTFIRLWIKHGRHWSSRTEAKLRLPGKGPEELLLHQEWYEELLLLQDRKRQAVQTWKTQKNQRVQSLRKRREEEEEEERRKNAAQHHNHQHRTEEERRELVLQLEEWREEKKRLEEQEAEQRAAAEIQKRRREKEEQRQQQEVKMMMEEKILLRRREEDERRRREREKERAEEEQRRKEATRSVRRFSQRDLHKVEVKVHEKQQKEKEEEERKERMAARLREKVNVGVNKDPSRLTTPTKGWQERLKHVGPSESGPPSRVFHRGVPTWRRGL